MKASRLLLAFALAMGGTGAAAAETWKADPVHSQVQFSVTHMVVSEVQGRFNEFEVTLTQGGPDFAGSTVEATIKTATVNTENAMRDRHLRSDDFFNAEKFPLITFKSTKFEKTGDNTFAITGDLTIRDVTKPVVLATKFTGIVTDPYGVVRAGFKATTTIKRKEFGVKYNQALETGGLVVSDDVTITLLMELTKQK
jgi:polyisoprenoid-binding protein YceI